MYVREYLQFQAAIFKADPNQIEGCIDRVGLTTEVHKKIHQLSKGYQQRVGLAAAILHHPKVLILDEPTTGLDPNQLIEIRALIKQLGKDKTVLFSTHIMQEVEAVCDRVIIIQKGKIIIDKQLAELQNNKQQVIKVVFDSPFDKEKINQLQGVVSLKHIEKNTWQFIFENTQDMRPRLFDFAKENSFRILELSLESKTLERLFTELTSN